EYRDATNSAIERGDAAIRLFEKDLVRLLRGIDTILVLLRTSYEANPQAFDLVTLTQKVKTDLQIDTEIGLATPDGYLRQRTDMELRSPIYIGDRKHFRLQAERAEDGLVVGNPIILRATGKPVIPLSRRIRTADGAFAGTIMGTIDPSFSEEFS